ncbi:MAG TPA: type III pantothenate kinase [Fulvivirga sp.]|nr:type III pantothenate kinase [Fulvivirga sp.]
MNLVIDFGNSAGKAALFEKEEIIKIFNPVRLEEISHIYNSHLIDNILISSTGVDPAMINKHVNNQGQILSYKSKLPFILEYKTPETLGLDRIAAVAGATFLFPEKNCLVIDMGTCITYDVLIENKHLGGGISPGINMRLKALHTFTANLPLVELQNEVALVGDTTQSAILSGVVNGVKAEIEEIIRMYSDNYGSLQIIICGGDCVFFENKLKASIFAAPELVLRGLNGILQYNVS